LVGAVLGVLAAYGILAGIRALLPRYAFAPEVVIRINVPVLFFSARRSIGNRDPVRIMASGTALADAHR